MRHLGCGNPSSAAAGAEEKRDWIALGIAAVFTLAALLPYAGFDLLSDMGMQYINIEACVYQVPSMAVMTRK